MEKARSLLPLAAFCAFLTKIMLVPPTFPDALVLLAIISYVIFDQYRFRETKLVTIEQRFKNLEDINKKFQEDIKHLQTSVSSVKMSSGLRSPLAKNTPDKGF